jgi:hypothetical protein
MKKALSVLAFSVLASGAFAQGNFLAGNVQTIFEKDGVTKLGTSYFAQVYVGSSADSLTAVGSPVAFLSSGGNFFGGTLATTFAGGATVTMVVRAWSSAAGATYEAAVASGLTQFQAGSSAAFTHKLGDPTASPQVPASVLSGMTSFSLSSIAPVPEPGVMSLAAIGGLGLMVLRRKNA